MEIGTRVQDRDGYEGVLTEVDLSGVWYEEQIVQVTYPDGSQMDWTASDLTELPRYEGVTSKYVTVILEWSGAVSEDSLATIEQSLLRYDGVVAVTASLGR